MERVKIEQQLKSEMTAPESEAEEKRILEIGE